MGQRIDSKSISRRVNPTSSIEKAHSLKNGVTHSMSLNAMKRIFSRRLKELCVFQIVLLAVFSWPLVQWVQFGLATDVYSHILIIPAVSAYLIWVRRLEIPLRVRHKTSWSAVFFVAGILCLAGYGLARLLGWSPSLNDHVTLMILGYLLCAMGGGFLFLGTEILRALRFPLLILIFMVPFPTIVTHWIEIFFQYTSADVAYVFLKLSGTPVFRDGLMFQIPGIVLEVAQECSGIRSSLALFIASLLAGHLLLDTPWKRVFLTLFVIPLAIVRNAFRILTIGLLCVHISPDMVHSWVHLRGGTLFFVISLIPFFLLLLILKRTEKAPKPTTKPARPSDS
jgi:exosortase C (VPDSG-CTERM-specific)